MNSYLLLSIITIVSGGIVMAMKICFASKCESVNICFGFIRVDRNVSIEDTEFHNEEKSENYEIRQKKNETEKV